MSSEYISRVLITGGGRRIGAALALRCAQLGCQVYVHAHQSQDEAHALVAALPGRTQHQVTVCDLSDPAERRNWLESLPEFDIVINNASVYRLTAPGAMESAADRERYWQVNYFAPLEIIQKQYLQKLTPAGGKLAITLLDCEVMTADNRIKEYSELAPGVDSYLASRIKLAHELKALAAAHAPVQRINAIAPGPVLPPVNCTTPGMTRILERVPMRQPVKVEEIANAVEFFRKNHSLTGVILPVDGGMHLI